MLGTLCLNEMEHLPKLVEQHLSWPGLVRWVFVEGADPQYAGANPDMVAGNGLSVDGTSSFLRNLAANNDRVEYVPHGWMRSPVSPKQNKCDGRNRYLERADAVEPDLVVVLDADEFWTASSQESLPEEAAKASEAFNGFNVPQRHIWRPPSIAGMPLMRLEAVGAYWGVPHPRVWRWRAGMRHGANHNWPDGARIGGLPGAGPIVHLGFASRLRSRAAKRRYYRARGEGPKDGRQMYQDCRVAFEQWRPGDPLPHGGEVVSYDGPVPECFR